MIDYYEKQIESLRREIAQLREMRPPVVQIIGKRKDHDEVLQVIRAYLDLHAGWTIEVNLGAAANGSEVQK